jgi:hypothetical protein
MEDRKIKTSPVWGWYWWEERVKEGEYGGSTAYLCMKVEQ